MRSAPHRRLARDCNGLRIRAALAGAATRAGIGALLLALGSGCSSDAGTPAFPGDPGLNGTPRQDAGSEPDAPSSSASQPDAGRDDAQAPSQGAGAAFFVCNPTLRAPEQALRRLSSSQYLGRLRELVELSAPDHSAAVLSELSGVLGALPRDLRSGPDPDYGGLRRLDQSIYAEAVEGGHDVAVALGAALTSSPERLRAAVGECALDANTENDAACVDAFIRKLGKRAFQRPLSEADVAFYRDVVQDAPPSAADYADIVALLVSSPFFLYAIELGEVGSAPRGTVALTAHELAARLALHFWQSGPDERLLAAAESGALLDERGYTAEVERVYADAKTERMLEELFSDWLEPKHLEELHVDIGSFDYDALRGDFTPGPELKSRMLHELGRMGAYYAHRKASTFAELFQSRRSFAETSDLAAIYGVPVWDGAAEPPQFPEPEREGLLTRAALVATGHATSHPIFKGVYARRTVLCDALPQPPADANKVAMGVVPENVTSRAVTEALSAARADCAGCHSSLINPIGFTLEQFDGLGRFRSVERVFDPKNGVLLAEEPVDSTAVPRVLPEDMREARGAADLHRFMLESKRPQACFVRHYFRYTFAREEDDARDACVLEALLSPLLAGDSLGATLRAIALRPEFRHRSYEP
jgi:hypothetical protein